MISQRINFKHFNQCGFSLIELMIAMVLGLALISGGITIFVSNIRTSALSQDISSMQANARFALSLMGHDARTAGYSGCAGGPTSPITIKAESAPTSNLSKSMITGAVIAADGWQPVHPHGYTPPTTWGVPVVGTHALMLQYGIPSDITLSTTMSSRGSDLIVQGDISDIWDGDLAIIATCDSGDLFEISSISTSESQTTITPATALTQPYTVTADSQNQAQVLKFYSRLYYVGDTGRANSNGDQIRALFEQSFPYDMVSNPPIELVEGVDLLIVKFGVKLANESIVFVDAGDPNFDQTRVSSIELGLLIASHKRYTESKKNRRFYLAGTTVIASDATQETGAAYYPADQRLRMPFNTTIKVRNRRL